MRISVSTCRRSAVALSSCCQLFSCYVKPRRSVPADTNQARSLKLRKGLKLSVVTKLQTESQNKYADYKPVIRISVLSVCIGTILKDTNEIQVTL